MLIVEKTDINDASFFIELIKRTAGYFPKLFGKKRYNALLLMYKNGNNLFSYKHVHKIQIEGEIAAMILSYDHKTKYKENRGTGYLLFKYSKFDMLRRISSLLKFDKTIGQLNPDEYYISNIAVFPKYQGRGLAKKLLAHIQQIAINAKLKNLVLDVECNNEPAIKLYLSLGYIKTESFNISIINDKLKFNRMKKLLK